MVDERHLAEDDLPGGNLMTSVAQLERIRAEADLVPVVEALQAKLWDPREAGLRRVFLEWVLRLAERLAPSGGALPPVQTLEELEMTLVERVAEWPKPWRQEGIEQGVKQASSRGLLNNARSSAGRRRCGSAETESRVSEAVERIADPRVWPRRAIESCGPTPATS